MIEKKYARRSKIHRATNETDITVDLCLDGTGKSQIITGVPFLDHMLDLFTRHGGFDMELAATGDLTVDAHHTVEDIGICIGQAVNDALGTKSGIRRYGHVLMPMDDALLLLAVDISGRGYLAYQVPMPACKVGDFDTELVEEFLRAFAQNAALTLHVQLMAGKNTHHIIEAVFKGLGRAMQAAVEIINPGGDIPSTKGVL